MRPERPSRHRSPPCGRRSPDRSSEKFACSIAEVTDPLALKVLFRANPAKHKALILNIAALHASGNGIVVPKPEALIRAWQQTPSPKFEP